MIEVYQTRFGSPSAATDPGTPVAEFGNCWEASLASILECDISEIPERVGTVSDDVAGDFADQEKWLADRFGLEPLWTDHVPAGIAVAVVLTGAGVNHSIVVEDGRPIHDPTPGRDDLDNYQAVFDYVALVPVGEPASVYVEAPPDALPRLDDAHPARAT